MEGQGTAVGKKAPNFSLTSHGGANVTLLEELKLGPVMLVFYPGDFTPVCTKQLCNYRDHLLDFEKLGVRIIGISTNNSESHQKFAEKFDLPFRLLSDPDHKVAKMFECTSLLMLGRVSRAVVIINNQGVILYRYVEPTSLSRRKSEELLKILQDLESNKLLKR
jgi:peroxiredoxin Q/BCP